MVIPRLAGLIVRVRLTLAVFTVGLESVTLKASAALATAVVGVPLITPLEEFSIRPPGNVPEVSVHVYGVVPPEAASVDE